MGITGHRGLPEATVRLIDRGIREQLAGYDPAETVGVSALADGADQIFARAVLDAGGRLEVVVPAREYRDGLPRDCLAEYDALLSRAAKVHRLDHVRSDEQAHMAAGEFMLGIIDELFAVWDGKPARGYGGTADVVALARARGLPVRVIWPEGATRD
ncbi:hypothetical protein C3Y87_14810 [Carbonactinospora thermoautotrophica]|nr:hypothetical protein [Carbonactinospora thermoautotrophica]